MRLLALLRFRDEAGRLPGYFASVAPQVDGIVALDNGSIDGSAGLARCEPKVVELLSRPRSPSWDESGDRRLLTEAGIRNGGDWLLGLDADERLEIGFGERVRAEIAQHRGRGHDAYALPIRELWDDPQTFRVDGIWGQKARTTLFRASDDHRFDDRPLHGQWASAAGPPIGSHPTIDARIYHLGTLTREDRVSRRDRYRELDPDARWQRIGYDYLTDETGLELARIEPDRMYEDVISAEQWSGTGPAAALEPRTQLRRVILHHTALRGPALIEDGRPAGNAFATELEYMRDIEGLHRDRGWPAIGYHFVIMPSGRVYEGRPLWAIGAHAEGHNRDSVGIALAGNFEEEPPQTPAIRSLEALLQRFDEGEEPLPLSCHGDLMPTACPGRFLREALASSRRRRGPAPVS